MHDAVVIRIEAGDQVHAERRAEHVRQEGSLNGHRDLVGGVAVAVHVLIAEHAQHLNERVEGRRRFDAELLDPRHVVHHDRLIGGGDDGLRHIVDVAVNRGQGSLDDRVLIQELLVVGHDVHILIELDEHAGGQVGHVVVGIRQLDDVRQVLTGGQHRADGIGIDGRVDQVPVDLDVRAGLQLVEQVRVGQVDGGVPGVHGQHADGGAFLGRQRQFADGLGIGGAAQRHDQSQSQSKDTGLLHDGGSPFLFCF